MVKALKNSGKDWIPSDVQKLKSLREAILRPV
jgi:hypothetical protein